MCNTTELLVSVEQGISPLIGAVADWVRESLRAFLAGTYKTGYCRSI